MQRAGLLQIFASNVIFRKAEKKHCKNYAVIHSTTIFEQF